MISQSLFCCLWNLFKCCRADATQIVPNLGVVIGFFTFSIYFALIKYTWLLKLGDVCIALSPHLPWITCFWHSCPVHISTWVWGYAPQNMWKMFRKVKYTFVGHIIIYNTNIESKWHRRFLWILLKQNIHVFAGDVASSMLCNADSCS